MAHCWSIHFVVHIPYPRDSRGRQRRGFELHRGSRGGRGGFLGCLRNMQRVAGEDCGGGARRPVGRNASDNDTVVYITSMDCNAGLLKCSP